MSRCSLDSKAEEDQKVPAETNTGDDERSSKKKKRGKGNKGKKRGREASEKDRAALKLFLEGLKGTRRLMVRTFCRYKSYVCIKV